jgi:ABC-type bacteriocin/lantibiotic exporter with double-glycine peptidase domain
MRRIVQRDDMDCGIACVAMLAGVTYGAVERLDEKWRRDGMDTKEIRKALRKFGFSSAKS